MSTLIALLAGYMTSGTWWIFPREMGFTGQCAACRKADATPFPGTPELLNAVFAALQGKPSMTHCSSCPQGLVPALQAFRASCLSSGRFRMAGGSSPWFDPTTALYATSDMVSNVCAVNHITINGDVASARRLLKSEHNWKTFLTLDQMLVHTHLGKSMPSRAKILAAYADDEDISA